MKKILLPLSYVLVIIATILGTLVVTQDSPVANSSAYKLQELENLLLERFVDGADSTQLQDAAAHAMVGALGDRWSYYIPKAEYDAYLENKNNSYVGIGVTIEQTELGYRIIKLSQDGPAQLAGILTGDVIVAVDGTRVASLTLDEGKAMVRGPENTQVQITVLRDGQELDFVVTRRTVATVVSSGVMLEDGIGLVTIVNFNANCYKSTMRAIEELLKEGATALIFDVRFNGGGYKSELVNILDDLLPEGALFRSEYYTGATSVDDSDAACLEIPMVVLINDQSFSAAEFFAAALREYEWAILVGTQTQGKGHYQETYLLSDGSAVGVSTGRYTTPNGVDLEGVGLTPDIIVEVDEETYARIYAGILDPMEDPQVLAAINALKTAKIP